jgi:hypothetical protein
MNSRSAMDDEGSAKRQRIEMEDLVLTGSIVDDDECAKRQRREAENLVVTGSM